MNKDHRLSLVFEGFQQGRVKLDYAESFRKYWEELQRGKRAAIRYHMDGNSAAVSGKFGCVMMADYTVTVSCDADYNSSRMIVKLNTPYRAMVHYTEIEKLRRFVDGMQILQSSSTVHGAGDLADY